MFTAAFAVAGRGEPERRISRYKNRRVEGKPRNRGRVLEAHLTPRSVSVPEIDKYRCPNRACRTEEMGESRIKFESLSFFDRRELECGRSFPRRLVASTRNPRSGRETCADSEEPNFQPAIRRANKDRRLRTRRSRSGLVQAPRYRSRENDRRKERG